MRFAIIDDEEYIRNQIRQLVETYCEEKRIPVDCICYKEAVTFLQEYRASFDAVFMDIKMPGYNGLEAAKILRQTDKNVPLVFITNLNNMPFMGIPSMRWALLLSHSFPMTSMYRWIRSSKEQQLSR